MAYSDVIIADSPVGYWSCESASSDTNQGSGSNPLVGQNTPTLVAGVVGNGLSLATASSEYLTVADENALDMDGSFSLEFWVKFNTLNNAGVINKGTAQPAMVIYDHGSGNYGFQGLKGNQFGCIEGSAVYVTTGVWYHVVWANDEGASYWKVYINGVDQTSYTQSTSGWSGNSSELQFGHPTGGGADYLDGVVDEIAIYDYALTSGQVSAHYAAGANATITPPSANVTWTGLDADLDITGSANLSADVANITWLGLDATVSTESTVTVTVDNTPNVLWEMPEVAIRHLDVLFDNPVAMWLLDGTNYPSSSVPGHVVFADITGNGNHLKFESGGGNIHPALMTGYEAEDGFNAIDFNGGLSSFYSDLTPAADHSIEFWLNWESGNQEGAIWSGDGGVSGAFGVTHQVVDIEPGAGTTWRHKIFVNANGFSDSVTLSEDPNYYPTDEWWHFAFTCDSLGSNQYQIKSYINGILATDRTITSSTGFKLYNTLAGFYNFRFGSPPAIGGGSHLNWGYDNLAVFNSVLSIGQVQAHAAGISHLVITVTNTPNVTWTGLDAAFAAAQNANIPVDRGEVIWTIFTPILEIDGFVDITAELASVNWVGFDATLLSEAFNEQVVTNAPDATFTALQASVLTRPDNLTFAFIHPNATEFTALDAEEIVAISYGAVFIGEEKVRAFRLGNTSYIPTHFQISATSLNTVISNAVRFSLNRVDWSTTLLIESVPGNSITDVIYSKIVAPIEASVGNATFVITVVQNA